jgi:hypothetical protein
MAQFSMPRPEAETLTVSRSDSRSRISDAAVRLRRQYPDDTGPGSWALTAGTKVSVFAVSARVPSGLISEHRSAKASTATQVTGQREGRGL